MPRKAQYILTRALPYYFQSCGFLVYQEDRETIVLQHQEHIVSKFSADTEVPVLVDACCNHMMEERGL